MKLASEFFKALGDETRLRIITLLLDGAEYCVCDFMEALELPQSTASRHLAYLKNSGWVTNRRQNKWNYYRLNDDNSLMGKTFISALQITLPMTKQATHDKKQLLHYLKDKRADACK